MKPGDLSADHIVALFQGNPRLSLCLGFDGFDESCLGYVFNIELEANSYHFTNITGEQELTVPDGDSLS